MILALLLVMVFPILLFTSATGHIGFGLHDVASQSAGVRWCVKPSGVLRTVSYQLLNYVIRFRYLKWTWLIRQVQEFKHSSVSNATINNVVNTSGRERVWKAGPGVRKQPVFKGSAGSVAMKDPVRRPILS